VISLGPQSSTFCFYLPVRRSMFISNGLIRINGRTVLAGRYLP